MKNEVNRQCVRMYHFAKKRCQVIGIMILCAALLTGCGNSNRAVNDMKNVEQRDYATILVISEGVDGKRYHFDLGIAQEKRTGEKSQNEEVCSFDCNNFDELNEEYQMVKGKDLSLAHLKVILLGKKDKVEEVFLNRNPIQEKVDQICIIEELAETLILLDENEEIAKTCPILQLDERDSFLDYLQQAEEPVGSYISNLIETNEWLGKDIPWLKDYLKVIREGDSLLVYTLESVEEGWKISCNSEIVG